MKTNLAYIDDVMDRKVDATNDNILSSLMPDDLASAKSAGTRRVAGFEVFDEAAERAALDRIIAARRAVIDRFRADRTTAKKRLAGLGIEPLAIIPLLAWDRICDSTGLFRLTPDSEGRVGVLGSAFDGYVIRTTEEKRGMFGNNYISASYRMDEASVEIINNHARQNWREFLTKMFGGLVAPRAPDPMRYFQSNLIHATLELPLAPDDVKSVLVKAAADPNLQMKVAAVAEAIGFKETPAELLRRHVARREQEARQREMIDADPIIYYEEGTAAAILAQFGDFPVEKDVVDAVAASGDLIGDGRGMSRIEDIADDLHARYLRQAQAQMRALEMQNVGAIQAGNQLGLGGISASNWTGR